eukprot:101950_1
MNASMNAANTEITTPANGLPQNSSILDTSKSTLIITARDSIGNLSGNSELFWVELNKEGTCEIGYGSVSCQVLCYPFTEPHVTAKQCESSYYTKGRVTKTSDTALWVIANVVSSGASTYTATYHESVEVSDDYIVTVYVLTNGGLYARYWDNIWFTGDPSVSTIASEINYQWGADAAITTYGTDYISARWEGKISPPYNESYKFYLYADDGSRLWIDKQLIIDGWDECCNESWGAVQLTADLFHDIVVEYKEIRADAYIELRWSSDSISKSIVPSTYLYYQSNIKNSPFDDSPIYISSGNVSYQQTVVNDEAPFQNNIAGVNNSVYVTAKDPFGHVLDTDTAAFNITNLDGTTSTQEWQGSGIYKITFMALTKTTDSGQPFYIQLNNNNILNSPYTVFVEPSSTSPLNSSLHGDGLSAAVAGFSAYFNITVYDIYGNERNSDGDTINVRFYGTAAGHATCEYLLSGKGIYVCSYTLTKTGVYTPEITINGVIYPLNPSNTINVSCGIIHGPTCNILNIESLDTTISAGYPQNFTIQSRDQFANALSTTTDNYVVNISDGTTIINASVSSMGNGQYLVTFVPSTTGSYDVNALLDNTTHILDSPFTIDVIPGGPVASASYVINGTGHQTAQSNIETYFIVQLRDLYGNPLVDDVTTNVFDLAILSCSSTNTTVDCSYYASGKYNCSYTPTQSGSCALHLTISSLAITNSPFVITTSPGQISATYTFAYGIQDGIAGSIQSFVIQAQDSHGNNLTTGGHTFRAKLMDAHSIYPDITGDIIDNTDGSYTVQYVTTIASVYEALAVELIAVGGLLGNYYTDYSFTNLHSIYGENVVDAMVAFDWGHGPPLDNFPASDYFSVQWIGYLYPPYSETYTIYTNIYGGSGIRLYINNDLLIDQFDPLQGEADPFIMIQLTANTFYDIQIAFREETGASKLSLEWESASISRTPIISDYLYYIKNIVSISNLSIASSTTLASACTVTGTGLTTAIAGFDTTFSIIAKDSYGNIQTEAGNEATHFKLYLMDDATNQINGSITGTDGEYTARYTVSNTSQQYTLYITYNGANVASSPYTIVATAGNLSAVQSSAVLSNGRAGESQIFLLYVRDDNGNLIDNAAVSLSVLLTHVLTSSTVTTSDIVDHNTGIYTITYRTTLSGAYTPSISINGTVLSTITPTVNISEAMASPFNSYVKGWASGAVGSLSTSTTIQKTVQLVDIYANIISVPGGYHFYVSLQNATMMVVTQGVITDGLNGTYLVNFTVPSSSGTYYLNVLLASGDIDTADGLTGAYFNNRWLYDVPYNTQIDTNISLNWNDGLITETAKNFVSVRWSGYVQPSYAENYTFWITSDDGSRLYIDNELIFDDFLNNAGTFTGSYTFHTAQLLYPIKIEYRENTGNANITLQWQSASQSQQIIPQSALFSNASHIKSSPFTLTVT